MPVGSETARVSHRLVESSREVIGNVTTRRLAMFAAAAAVLLLLVLGGGSFFPSRGLDPAPERPAAGAMTGVEPSIGAGEKLDRPTPPHETEEGDETATPPDGSDEPVVGEREPAGPPRGFFPDFHGTVVDMDTGEPIGGARVIYGSAGRTWGAHSRTDGTFRVFDGDDAPESLDPGRPFLVRVYAAGYEPMATEPREADVRLELRPLTGPPRYGRIRGRAEDATGGRLSGVLSVRIVTDSDRTEYLAVLADESGAFVLDSVPPGGCRLSLEQGEFASVFVPEGGDAEIVLRAGIRARDDLAEEGEKRLQQLAEARHQLEARLAQLPKDSDEAEGVEFQIIQTKLWERDILRKLPVRARERVAVTISGLADAEGVRIVAEGSRRGSTERWWAVARGGEARFPALFAGSWQLTLLDVRGARKSTVTVATDGGAVTVPFDGD